MTKRAMDLIVSIIGLLLLSPFFLFIGIAIKLDSRGPIFYRQERVGKNARLFKLFKFRTMNVGADKQTAITVGKRDPRITRVGATLRKFKLDELPQLINVIIGDMSLVGPRPELKKFVDLYNERQRQVLSIKPGITDYASLEFRNENELLEGKADPVNYYIAEILPAKLDLSLGYLSHQSVWVDLKIIVRTIWAVVSRG